MHGLHITLVLSVPLLTAADPAVAADSVRPTDERAIDSPDRRIQQWIEGLGSSSYAVRRRATHALLNAGLPAVSAVREAALGNLEVSVRAIEILQSLYQSGDVRLAGAAETALQTVAGSHNRVAASRASAALKRVRERAVAAIKQLGASTLLSKQGRVKHVEFHHTYVTAAGLEYQQKAGAIVRFDAAGQPVADKRVSWSQLSRLERARRKFVVRAKVTDADLVHLVPLTDLQRLNIQHMQITNDGLVYLQGLTNLRYLVLNEEITDAGLVHLANLKRLEWLCLAQTKLTGDGLKHLQGLRSLKDLNLINTPLTDSGLVHLRGHTQLNGLNLGHTRVTDAGFENLKGLNQLRCLTLFGVRVTDQGLAHLRGMHQLKVLNLDNTRVTDAGLMSLRGLSSLEAISVTRPQVTDAGVKMFQQAMPGTKVHLWDPPK